MDKQRKAHTSPFTPDRVLPHLPGYSFVIENDENLTIRFVLPRDTSSWGYAAEDFVNNQRFFAASVIHPDDLDMVDAQYEKAASGRFVMSRHRLIRADGSPRLVLVSNRGALGADGRCHGVVGYAIEIDGIEGLRGRPEILCDVPDTAEPDATEPDERPSADWVARQLPGVNFVCNADEMYHLHFLSGASCHSLLGYDVSEFLGDATKFPAWVIHPDDLDLVDELFDRTLEDRGRTGVVRFRMLRADGEVLPVLECLRALPEREGNKLCGWQLSLGGAPRLQGPTAILGWL